MKLTNDKGITLQTLVITIVLLLILTSIGATAGTSALEYSKYSRLKTEMQLLQTKVNVLNEKGDYSNGQDLSNTQKVILNTKEVSDIIYKDKEDADITKITNGFKFYSSSTIKSVFDISNIDRSYLINVEYRYVVSCEGFKYKNVTYYMIDQMDDGMYNVEYHNKNINPDSSEQLFEVGKKTDGDECKIVVSNIKYDGYVNNWQVKYKLNTEEEWQVSNSLEFVVEKSGTYNIKVVHGDEIDLGQQNIDVDAVVDYKKQDGSWNGVSNSPKIMAGMIPVYFDENNNTVELTEDSEDEDWKKWFSYDNKKWANAITKNSEGQITGYWVWIPRYEYKINGTQIDVKFIRTSKNQVDKNYDHIHPAFEDGSEKGKNNHYMNGEWRDEIPGFWVAKFQAGFAGGNNDVTKVNTTLKFENVTSANFYGYYTKNVDYMKYPVFLGKTYAYNMIDIGDIYNLARNLTSENNIYGLKSDETDSHMLKNSEWGAVTYLTQSSYGVDGQDVIMMNDVYVKNSGGSYIYGITGYAEGIRDGVWNESSDVPPYGDEIKGKNVSYAWNTENGQRGSSTQNITGVYDLAGGMQEYVAAYIPNGNQYLTSNGKQFANSNKNVDGYKTYSTEYATTYPYSELDESSTDNLKKYISLKTEKYGYGDAIAELCTVDYEGNIKFNIYTRSYFNKDYCYMGRGESYHNTNGSSIFYTCLTGSGPAGDWGFRAVLIGTK